MSRQPRLKVVQDESPAPVRKVTEVDRIVEGLGGYDHLLGLVITHARSNVGIREGKPFYPKIQGCGMAKFVVEWGGKVRFFLELRRRGYMNREYYEYITVGFTDSRSVTR